MNKTTLRIVTIVSSLVLLACSTTTAVTPTVPPAAQPVVTLTSAPPPALTSMPPTTTSTVVPPTATSTTMPPTAAPTFTPIPPTATSTVIVRPPLQLTAHIPVLPTATSTSVPPLNPPVVTLAPRVPLLLSKPDLYVSEFQLTPNPPDHTKAVHVRVGVYNKGTAAAATPFKVEWWAGSNYPGPACMWTINSLPVNGGQILQCDKGAGTWGSGYAKITTQVRVDTGNVLAESDEGNNVYSVEIAVK